MKRQLRFQSTTARTLLGPCRRAGWLLGTALILPIAACSTAGSGVGETGYVLLSVDKRTVNALPAPRLSAVDRTGSCRDTPWAFEDDRAEAKWPADGYYMPLTHWGMTHAGSRVATSAPRCADRGLMIKLWQSAIGSPVTGKLSERDVDILVRSVDAVDSRYSFAAQQQRGEIDLPVEMFRSLAEGGDARAQFRLGSVYEKRGEKDKAILWYGRAAAQGLELAQARLDVLVPRSSRSTTSTQAIAGTRRRQTAQPEYIDDNEAEQMRIMEERQMIESQRRQQEYFLQRSLQEQRERDLARGIGYDPAR